MLSLSSSWSRLSTVAKRSSSSRSTAVATCSWSAPSSILTSTSASLLRVEVRPRACCCGSTKSPKKSVRSLNVPRTSYLARACRCGVSTRHRVADLEVLGFSANPLSRIAPLPPSARERGVRRPPPTRCRTPGSRVAGSMPGHELGAASTLLDLALVEPDGRRRIDAIDSATARPAAAGKGEKPSLFCMVRSPVMSCVDRVVDRRLEPGREDRDEGDQREPDHQSRRGRRRAARVARGVLAREPPGHAAKPLERPAHERGQRLDQPRAEQRHGDEEDQRAEARAGWPRSRRSRCRRRGRRRAPRGQARRGRPRSRGPSAGARAVAPRPRRAPPSGTPAWRASPATRAATRVTSVPTSSETTIVRVATTVPVLGRSMPPDLNSSPMPYATPRPARSPSTEPSRPISRASRMHRGEDLPPRGAERAQQPELAAALGDGDREGVEDRERAHEERDEREHEQRGLQEAEVVGGVLRLGVGVLLAGPDLHCVAASRPPPAA